MHAGLVEFGQFDENIRGAIHISALIAAVNALTTVEHLGDLGLGQVHVLSQIANSFVRHALTSEKTYGGQCALLEF